MKHLSKAMAQVMTVVSRVPKRSVQGLGYKISTEADVIEAMKEGFLSSGLVIFPVDMELLASESYTSAKGAHVNKSTVKATYRIVHADSGESIDIAMLGEGADNGDKSVAKALTMAYKYLFRQATMLLTGDDPDTTPSSAHQRNGKAASNEESLTPMQRYHRAMEAVSRADTIDRLEKYANKVRQIGFPPQQLAALDQAIEKRRSELKEGVADDIRQRQDRSVRSPSA